jgi:hypothetical protein
MLVDYTVIGDKSQSFLCQTTGYIRTAAIAQWLPPLFNIRFIINALNPLELIAYKVSSPEYP